MQCSVHHSNRCTVCATGELYGYGHSNVLFKPTKAADEPFRPTPESAMSYFVGGTAVENGLEEDAGFAINGGKGWSKVEYAPVRARTSQPRVITLAEPHASE